MSMSFKIGKNLICDCCGTIYFLEHHSFSFGSENDKYDPIPEGWTKSTDIGDLCPICGKKYALSLQDMLGYDKVPKTWRELLV